ncbi:hypothetical protein O7634_17145 [Micromonospora sp. WMMD1120]|uniref:hypothetical protein n=1 Tax=Micromonospora sp. WMMD1120 TaxID=3016106 RepID=UPI0024165963|nr:hypothetical protein [Micromonospora sp. WMMD1120]MDG4808478.1 hypothetical protein [Micromonospora sp. WMMD1120]
MDADSNERRTGAPTAAIGRSRWRRFVERATVLQLVAVYWVPATLLIGVPVRWLFDRHEPLVELVLNAALNAVVIGPALYLGRRVAGEQGARRDPEGYPLREALRTGTAPGDGAARVELPGYLAGQRRATWRALASILGISLGLVLLALFAADNEGFAVVFGVVVAVSVAVAALTLTRIHRLASSLAVPNRPETRRQLG